MLLKLRHLGDGPKLMCEVRGYGVGRI